jgi:hypothetical protein
MLYFLSFMPAGMRLRKLIAYCRPFYTTSLSPLVPKESRKTFVSALLPGSYKQSTEINLVGSMQAFRLALHRAPSGRNRADSGWHRNLRQRITGGDRTTSRHPRSRMTVMTRMPA